MWLLSIKADPPFFFQLLPRLARTMYQDRRIVDGHSRTKEIRAVEVGRDAKFSFPLNPCLSTALAFIRLRPHINVSAIANSEIRIPMETC